MKTTTASIALLPCTGIQLVPVPSFTAADLKKWKPPRYRVNRALQATVEPAATQAAPVLESDEEEVSPFETRAPAPEASEPDQLVQADPLRAIDIAALNDGWLPLPMSARSALWAMLWVRRRTLAQDGEAVYEALIAVDTLATSDGTGGTLCAGGPDGAGDLPNDFRVEPFRPNNFWKHEAVERFFDRVVEKLEASGQWAQTPKTERSRGALQAHLVGLFEFLQARGLPTVNIASMPQGTDNRSVGDAPVNVTLVVDLGNSRTCGLLVEMDPLKDGEQRFTQLELCRLPKFPLVRVGRPFATHLAFVAPGYGVLHGEDVATFRDLSVVRLGDDAMDALRACDADFGVRGMSSPKRYMWDGDHRREPWVLAQPQRLEEGAGIWGDLLCRLGIHDPFAEPQVPQPDEAHPIRPDYARKVGALFAFVEILEHAFRQANGCDYRRALLRQPGYQRRRVIRQVVVMHPAGMHSKEVRAFTEAIDRAIQLWTEFRTDPVLFRQGNPVPLNPNLLPRPTLQVSCDEGFAIQACFLYAETIGRFNQDTQRLLRTYGHTAYGRPALRLASIDVGGGTIDISIADYTPPAESRHLALPTYEVRRLFHDGISRAGDDIVRSILERSVFESIAIQLGVSEDSWNALFSPAPGDDDAAWAIYRRRLVSGLWLPLVHELLSQIEGSDAVRAKVGDLLKYRDDAAIEELNRKLRAVARAGEKHSIEEVQLNVTPAHVYSAARDEIGTAVRQYADIIGQFRCDAVIVGGRASAIPAVRRLIVESFPAPPGSIVFLHEQAFGKWYPFSVNGYVSDSKTCAVVGAAIVFQGMHGLGRMALREDPQSFLEVPNVLGLLSPQEWQLRAHQVWFQGDEREARVDFQGPEVLVGARRLDSATAMARPVYRLALDPTLQQLQEDAPQRQEPLLVRLERATSTGDDLRIASVEGEWKALRDGKLICYTDPNVLRKAVRCQLQTLIQHDHWLDSGCFNDLRVNHEHRQ